MHVTIESNNRISRISIGYQPDINPFCTSDIMSCHPLINFKVTILNIFHERVIFGFGRFLGQSIRVVHKNNRLRKVREF